MRILILSALVFLSNTQAQGQNPQFPPKLRAITATIYVPTCPVPVGSGFFVNRSNQIFFITAAHVLFDMNMLPPRLKQDALSLRIQVNDLGLDVQVDVELSRLSFDGRFRPHPSRDIAACYIGFLSEPKRLWPAKGVKLPKTRVDSPFCLCEEQFICSTNVSVGTRALILGYPTELLLSGNDQVDFSEPLVRSGILSQKNSRTGKYIIDSGVFGGNSGGPLVIELHESITTTQFKIAGLMTQFVPANTRVVPGAGMTSVLAYSGYSVAEPIDAVMELVATFD